MITPETIADIRAALDVATPEPWYRHERDLNYIYSGQKIVGLTQSDRTSSTLNDAILICLLRNHTPALLDEIERLRAELDRITNDRNNQLDRLRAAAGDAERLRARVAELDAEKKTWKNALEELTPGGSEFVDNPKRCADFVRAKIETMWKVIASKSRRVAELEAERDEQNAVLREATQKLVELNVKNAVLKEKLRTAEDFNENYTVIDDIGPLPKCFHCAHQQSMAFRGPDAPCYQCGIDKGYPKFKADKP